jgi:Na+-transporting methylmalonyl-CoA/oxaloacetate decarboxylase gamma subunit
MKTLSIVFAFLISLPVWSVSLKSVEASSTREELQTSKAWDNEEAMAQDREERIRAIDEARAAGYEPQMQEAEKVEVDCKCSPK